MNEIQRRVECILSQLSAKGWVVIPKSIREKHGLKKGSRVQVLDYGQILTIVPLPDDPVEALHGMFEGGPSLAGELLAERKIERAREEQTGDENLCPG